MSCSTIPQDILEDIVGHLDADTDGDTLRTCALASRALASSCQAIMFRNILIGSSARCLSFHSIILAHPALAKAARKLTIVNQYERPSTSWYKDNLILGHIFHACTHVHTLALHAVMDLRALPLSTEGPTSTSRPLPMLGTLFLAERSHVGSCSLFAATITAFPALKHVVLSPWTSFVCMSHGAPNNPTLHLETLELRPPVVLRDRCTYHLGASIALLKELRAEINDARDLVQVQLLLRCLAQSLQGLQISISIEPFRGGYPGEFDNVTRNIDLKYVPNLHFLSLGMLDLRSRRSPRGAENLGERPQGENDWLSILVDQLPVPSPLRVLTLSMCLGDINDLKGLRHDYLDKILSSSSRFPFLAQVQFHIRGDDLLKTSVINTQIIKSLQNRMPMLHTQGLIQVKIASHLPLFSPTPSNLLEAEPVERVWRTEAPKFLAD